MDKIYIFDVDGTLTPSRLRMTEEFAKFFDKWSSKNKYYLVTGSDLDKTKEQVPIAYIDRAVAIFTCCGNEMWLGDKQVLTKEFKPPQDLLDYLQKLVNSELNYPVKTGNHIEDRGSLLNFSIVGRDCTLIQRLDYYRYDKQMNERKDIADYIMKKWPELDAVIGGQISIDIYPKGNDKSQVLERVFDFHEFPDEDELTNEYIFIGDGIENGGNDYPLAHLMDNMKNCDWYDTKDWKQTKLILEKLSD